MPPFPGEERLVTLFTDCHYYFAQPTARPVLHRFDKASYFYVYWNATRHTSRIEVANNPGTPEQDAFNGSLDTCRVINSYKFPNLVTIIVDAIDHAPSPTTSKAGRDPEEWQLQTTDPRDTSRTKYRLHTIDFYFWTQEDAKLVTDFFRKLLSPIQLDLVESKQQPQQQNRQSRDTGVSSVVQNLEHVAISDPAYSNGQTRNSQNQPQSQATGMPLPPPPPPPLSSSQPRADPRSSASQPATSPSPVSPVSRTESRKSPKVEKPAVDYTPMAYNPAAPAAPEKIAHREKTPPPEDGDQGTGLTAAARHESVSQPAYNPSSSWGAPPSTSQLSQSRQWGSPPPPTATSGYGSQISSTAGHVSPQPSSQYQQSQTSTLAGPPSFAPPPINTLVSSPTSQDPHRHSIAAEMYTPDPRTSQQSQSQPIETPGSEFYNTIQQPSRPLQHVQPQYPDYLSGGTKPGPQPPPGGWSEYSYDHNNQSYQSNQSNQSNTYDVHNQVYRPTEAEASHGHSSHHKPSKTETAPSSSSNKSFRGKLFSKIEGLENKSKKYIDRF